MTPSELIVKGWNDANGEAVPIWADELPAEEQQTFPVAVYIHAGFADDDGPLSGSKLETERFEVIVQAKDRRECRTLARRAKKAFEDLEDSTLANATAEIADLTIRRQDGSVRFWETTVSVSLVLWDQMES